MTKNKYCDLHTHSIFSDGTSTTTEIITTAEKQGLSAVALCDHNTTDGLTEFLHTAENSSVLAIAGAEFSVDYMGTELHLLGLFLPEDAFAPISKLMNSAKQRKENSNIELIHALKKADIHLNYDEIKKRTPNGLVNRSHIAEEMVKKGYISSIAEGFETYLSKNSFFYKKPKRISVFEMIEIIKNFGGAPVLAHPLLNLNEEQLIKFLPKAKVCGLIGMECYYSTYTNEETSLCLDLIEKFALLPSGGSDFHGYKKPDINLGVGKGNLKIPFEWALSIKNQINFSK